VPGLKKHLADFIRWKRHAGEPTAENDALFHGRRGPMTVRGVQQAWESAVRRAKLPRQLGVHAARHSCLQTLYERTGDIRLVQHFAGHASVATTAAMYTSVTYERMEQAVRGLYVAPGGEGSSLSEEAKAAIAILKKLGHTATDARRRVQAVLGAEPTATAAELVKLALPAAQ
jgi:hypothetical protein